LSDPYSGWRQTPELLTGGATASAPVFLDKNGNGRRDPGDPPLRDVGFFANDSGGRAFTDSKGVALLTSFPAYEPTRLRISRSSLGSPMWVPTQDDPIVRARPGAGLRLVLSVTPTGDIDGIVYGARNGEPCGLGAVELELVNVAGAVVKTSRSAYDGYYTFGEVPVGKYTLRTKLSAGLMAWYHPCELKVVIEGDEPIVDGADLTLRPTEGFLTEGARASR
jgi:hypothetical protein